MMRITCDFVFCIYEKDGVCTLDEIGINGCGSCHCCIVAPPEDEEALQTKKNELLEKYGDE